VKDINIPSHWERDFIVGKNHKTAMGIIVERSNRTVILVPLKTYCKSVMKPFAKALKSLPKQMMLSMSYNQGKEKFENKIF
jgi:IS30 family transposase